jgi:hypothetical protein
MVLLQQPKSITEVLGAWLKLTTTDIEWIQLISKMKLQDGISQQHNNVRGIWINAADFGAVNKEFRKVLKTFFSLYQKQVTIRKHNPHASYPSFLGLTTGFAAFTFALVHWKQSRLVQVCAGKLPSGSG